MRGEGGVRGGTWEAAEEGLWVCLMGGVFFCFVFCEGNELVSRLDCHSVTGDPSWNTQPLGL